MGLPPVLLSALILALFLYYGNLQQQEMVSSLDRAASRAVNLLQVRLAWQEGALQAVRGLFTASGQVTRSEFRTFTLLILARTDGLVALSWDPLVTREQRPAFERHLQEIYADSGLGIRERRDGSIQPARAYATHVVVERIEPFERHRAALGYDIQSDPIRALALHHALEHGSVQATAPIQLVQGNRSQLGILNVLAVFDEPGSVRRLADRDRQLRGFVVGVILPDDLVATTFAAPVWKELNLQLKDVTTPEEPILLATTPSHLTTIEQAGVWSRTHQYEHEIVQRRRFQQAGRDWQLEVRPNPAFFLRQSASNVPVLLVGGLSLVAVLEALLLLISGTELESRRGLEEKLRLSLMTAALAHEIKQPLSALLLQSRMVCQLASDQNQLAQNTALDQAILGMQESCRSVGQSITAIQELLSHRCTNSASLNLSDLVHNALLILKSDAMGRGIHLQSWGLEQPRVVIGDAQQLQLMVLNLLRNSLEATPAGGVVEVGLELNRDVVELRVGDSGPGFVTHLSDPDQFLLASSKTGGFGLGLFMVRTAADNHGAKIRFGRSRLGGAEVAVRFPARLVRTARRSRAD